AGRVLGDHHRATSIVDESGGTGRRAGTANDRGTGRCHRHEVRVAALSDGVVALRETGKGRAATSDGRTGRADRRGHGDAGRGTTREGEGEGAVAAVGGLRDHDLTDGLVGEATRRGAAGRDTRTTDRRADRGKAGGNRLAHCERVVW